MRQTPAQRHFARVTAAKSVAASEHGASVAGGTYELMLIRLAEDRRRLKAIHSIERKIEVKREILAAYQDWVIAALDGGKGAQDDVLTTVLVWHIDAANFGIALQIADYVIKHALNLPDQYNRNVATMLMDEVAGAYLAGKFDGQESAVMTLAFTAFLVKDLDAPDQARAKLEKAMGYAALDIVDTACDKDSDAIKPDMLDLAKMAETHLRRAVALYDGVGVKKDIERLERRLKKASSG